MQQKMIVGIAALALGTALASAPALAKSKTTPAAPTYSNTGPWGAPLSPNGISAAASAYGGPGFNGPYDQAPAHGTLMAYVPGGGTPQGRQSAHTAPPPAYSNTGPWGAPLSPNGISAAANAYGGPGFNGPY